MSSQRRFWTESEIATLRELYPTTTAEAVAKVLRRSTKAIEQAVGKYVPRKQARVAVDRKFLAAILRLNRSGQPDTEIAKELGCERRTVSKHRKALGLPSHAYGEVCRSKIRQATHLRCEREGVASLGELRSLAFRRFAQRQGWPAHLKPREVMVLDALDTCGPLTRRQIADAIGMPWKGSRKSLKCKYGRGSYLANLLNDGLVITFGRVKQVLGQGKGRSCHVYALAPTAARGEGQETDR